jgi:nicotinate-nucleotide adenylyltransferase
MPTPSGPLVILGGTFDPPHIGHLVLGECARVQFDAERVLFMPAGDPWRKTAEDAPARRTVTPADFRLAMTRHAIARNSSFAVDDREVRREGPTYTVDTLAALHAEGHTNLLLVLGTDALVDLPHWSRPGELVRLARIAVAEKPGAAGAVPALARAAGLGDPPEIVDMPPLAISSTLIRARAAAGKPIRYLVPAAVEAFIHEHGLYRDHSRP